MVFEIVIILIAIFIVIWMAFLLLIIFFVWIENILNVFIWIIDIIVFIGFQLLSLLTSLHSKYASTILQYIMFSVSVCF